jgi:ribosome-associated heat shock protein Hsp15
LTIGFGAAAATSRRLDQWLWFARLAKSRSLAARLCAAGDVELNGATIRKPHYLVRPGDAIVAPQGGYRRTVRVLQLGSRRGPPTEARLLYEETAAPVRLTGLVAAWEPLLADGEAID